MYIFVVFSKEQDRKYSIHLFRVWERPITWSRLCALIYKRQFMLKVVDSKKFPSLFQAQMGKVWCYIYIKSIFAGKNCISKGFCKRKNRKSWGFSCIRFFFFCFLWWFVKSWDIFACVHSGGDYHSWCAFFMVSWAFCRISHGCLRTYQGLSIIIDSGLHSIMFVLWANLYIWK